MTNSPSIRMALSDLLPLLLTLTLWFCSMIPRLPLFSSNIYRFSPIVIAMEDVSMFHGPNERISCTNLLNLRRLYTHLLTRTVLMEDPTTNTTSAGGASRL